MALSPPASKLNGRLRCRRSRDRRRQLQACLPRPCPPASPPGVPVLISRTLNSWLARRDASRGDSFYGCALAIAQLRALWRCGRFGDTAAAGDSAACATAYARRRARHASKHGCIAPYPAPALPPMQQAGQQSSGTPMLQHPAPKVPELHHLDCLRPRRRPRPPRRPSCCAGATAATVYGNPPDQVSAHALLNTPTSPQTGRIAARASKSLTCAQVAAVALRDLTGAPAKA